MSILCLCSQLDSEKTRLQTDFDQRLAQSSLSQSDEIAQLKEQYVERDELCQRLHGELEAAQNEATTLRSQASALDKLQAERDRLLGEAEAERQRCAQLEEEMALAASGRDEADGVVSEKMAAFAAEIEDLRRELKEKQTISEESGKALRLMEAEHDRRVADLQVWVFCWIIHLFAFVFKMMSLLLLQPEATMVTRRSFRTIRPSLQILAFLFACLSLSPKKTFFELKTLTLSIC